MERIEQSWALLDTLTSYPHWFLAFSGGKDSTTLLVLTVEFLQRQRSSNVQLEILYADTRLEIPPMAQHAARILKHVNNIATVKSLPIRVHIIRSPVEESFWVLMLGKGYPAPGFRFRWCTDRLKVRPMNRLARTLCPDPYRAVMLVGVREGESQERDRRLRFGCGRGECGPAMVGKTSIFPTAAPLLNWRACEVWNFLIFTAPGWGWPTEELWRLYGEDERVRYGCWVCPLVREDRAMSAAIASADGERPVLEAMANFREELLHITRDPNNRELRADGRPGKLTWKIRHMLLQKLLTLQNRTGRTLIEPDELHQILHLWEKEASDGAKRLEAL